MAKNLTNKNKIWQIIWDITVKVFDYIYDFLFNWEDEPYEYKELVQSEKLRQSALKTNDETSATRLTQDSSTVSIIKSSNFEQNKDYYETLVEDFGKQTAEYMFRQKEEVDYLIEKHGLVRENTFKVMIPPEKIGDDQLGPGYFETVIEKIYSQYNSDVILRPKNLRMLNTQGGIFYGELEVEAYTVTEDLLSTV